MRDKLLDETLKKILFVIPSWKKTTTSFKTAPMKLRMSQFMILITIKEMGTCNMSALSDEEKMSAQQLTRVVNDLVEMKYIDRYTNPNNRREVLVTLTDAGKKALKEAQHMFVTSFKENLAQYSDESLKKLLQAFTLIEEVMEEGRDK